MATTAQTIERRTTWIDGDLIQQAKTVAAHDGVNIADVLERNLRPGLAAELKRVAGEIARPRRKAVPAADLGGEG